MKLETVIKVKLTEIELAKDGAETVPIGRHAGLRLIDIARMPGGFRYLGQIVNLLPDYIAPQAAQLVKQKWNYVSVNWPPHRDDHANRAYTQDELEEYLQSETPTEQADIPDRYKATLKPAYLKKVADRNRRYQNHLNKVNALTPMPETEKLPGEAELDDSDFFAASSVNRLKHEISFLIWIEELEKLQVARHRPVAFDSSETPRMSNGLPHDALRYQRETLTR
jgi:hypothetical protein